MTLLESSVDMIQKGERWKETRARVQLALIKLSEGIREELDNWVEMARKDYRDVLAHAEFPEEITSGFAADGRLSAHEQNEIGLIRARDRQQYEAWLKDDLDE